VETWRRGEISADVQVIAIFYVFVCKLISTPNAASPRLEEACYGPNSTC